MKLTAIFILFLTAAAANAQVYKCTAATGKTFYQDKPCPEAAKSEEIPIEAYDPDKFEAARRRLAEDLLNQAEYENLEAQREFREREIRAMERNARANEEMAEAARDTQEAYDNSYPYYDNLYYLPGYYGRPFAPRDRWRDRDPHRDPPPPPRSGVKAKIHLK
ncbi:MAG: DUF4124 domain-containing protein [Gammaproteobacteria bacterium]